MARVARVMAMVTQRAMASNNDNKTMATETTTMTKTKTALSTMTMMMTLMTTMKATTKTTITMVRRQWMAVAGGSGGGMKAAAVGVECSYFSSKLNSGCCLLLARGRGGRWEAYIIHPKKLTYI